MVETMSLEIRNIVVTSMARQLEFCFSSHWWFVHTDGQKPGEAGEVELEGYNK